MTKTHLFEFDIDAFSRPHLKGGKCSREETICGNEPSNEAKLLLRKLIISTGTPLGPSINYVVSKSAIFDPLPPLSRLFTK